MPTASAVISPSVAGSGSTWQTYYRRLADEFFYHQTVTSAQASGGEATRAVIAAEMRDDEEGANALGMAWVYASSATLTGVQRRIITDPGAGYQSEHGAHMVSRPYSSALATNTTVEYSSPLPIKSHLGVKGLATCVNEALARTKVAARLTLTGNGTNQIALSSYPFITDESQIVGVFDTRPLATSTDAAKESPYAARLVMNGVTRTLVTGTPWNYGTGDTFYVDISVPGDRLIYDGSAWSYVTTPGLQGDAWQAAAPEEWVLAFGMVRALEFLRRYVLMSKTISEAERDGWLADTEVRLRRWYRAAANYKRYAFPRPKASPPQGLALIGTRPPLWAG